MDHIEFVNAGLHNRHIVFIMNGRMYQGVVVDDHFHTTGKTKRTHYTFIPTENLIKHREAYREKDRATMDSLSSVVDIENIVWGKPVTETHHNIRESEFIVFLFELLRNDENFRNTKLEDEISGSNLIADITTEQKQNGKWVKLLIEVLPFATYTEGRIQQTIEQLNAIKHAIPGYQIVFSFPGVLPNQDNLRFGENDIKVWDLNFISSSFAVETANATSSPLVQSLFVKTDYSIQDKLINELKSIRTGDRKTNEWNRYQKYIQRVLDYLFGDKLSSPIIEHSDYFEVNRRDFILRNYADVGFWAHLRTRYLADYIVVDSKNLSEKVTKKEVLQVSNYLKLHGPGLFGMIISRNGGGESAYYTCREIWAMDKKLVIILNDDDIIKMIIAKGTTDNPEEIIRQRIEEFRLSM